jgi:hypothetical protein
MARQLNRIGGVLATCSAIALLVASLDACTSPGPSINATRVLHLESRVSQALVVSVSQRGGDQKFNTGLRPCGGRLDLTVGREIPVGDDWLIFLSYDPTGSFDAALAEWTADPHDLPGNFTVSPVWSRGDIRAGALPMWVTVTPDATRLETMPPADSLVPPCDGLASPEPQPSE